VKGAFTRRSLRLPLKYARIDLSDGATVSIYGNTYTTFFPGTNGYITFVHGDSTTTESPQNHFSGIPRISVLYDDLDPGAGQRR